MQEVTERIVAYNPDALWRTSFYKALHVLQLADVCNKVLINRDDQAVFQLDMTYTHKARGVLCEEVETNSSADYVNTYSSILQTTSYHVHALLKPSMCNLKIQQRALQIWEC